MRLRKKLVYLIFSRVFIALIVSLVFLSPRKLPSWSGDRHAICRPPSS